MCETAPYYFNWMLFFHRYLHDDSFTPEEEDRKKAAEMEEYVLANRANKKEWGLLQQEITRCSITPTMTTYILTFPSAFSVTI